MLRVIINDMLKERIEDQVAAVVFEEVSKDHLEGKRRKNVKRRIDKRHKRYKRSNQMQINRYMHMQRAYNNRYFAWDFSQRRRSEGRKELNAQLNDMYGVMCGDVLHAIQEFKRTKTEVAARNKQIIDANIAEETDIAYIIHEDLTWAEYKRHEMEYEEELIASWEAAEAEFAAYVAEKAAQRAKEREFHISDLLDEELEALAAFLSA